MTKNENTLSIIKPNAVYKNIIGNIIVRFETAKLYLIGIKMLKLYYEQAKKFYFIHNKKPFFNDLINFMTSGPIIVIVLEGEYAIRKNREIIGNTNPSNALAGTIRGDYADDITKNIIHGSDSIESANYEISFFFKKEELYNRCSFINN